MPAGVLLGLGPVFGLPGAVAVWAPQPPQLDAKPGEGPRVRGVKRTWCGWSVVQQANPADSTGRCGRGCQAGGGAQGEGG